MFSPRTYNDTLTTARLASGISNKLVNRQNRACQNNVSFTTQTFGHTTFANIATFYVGEMAQAATITLQSINLSNPKA